MANIERLEQLRRVVRDAPEDRFRMEAITKKLSCGTAHCAIGWAAVDPWFVANTDIPATGEIGHLSNWGSRGFGISENDADLLFAFDDSAGFRNSTGDQVTKAEVIANIDRLIAGEPAEPYYDDLDDMDDDDDLDLDDMDDDDDLDLDDTDEDA